MTLLLPLNLGRRGLCWPRPRRSTCSSSKANFGTAVEEVPDEDEAVVTAGGDMTAAVGCPFNAVDVVGVAAEFDEGLAGLADVEDAHDGRVLGEGGDEVLIVGGGWWRG